jgi:7-keto-8-aminopelargonate synthetase-like enzyme
MFDTALAPSAVGAALAALRVARADEERRQRLLRLTEVLWDELHAQGYDLLPADAAIIPMMIGDTGAALRLATALRERGVWVPAIRPPTVPRGAARLRVSLMATHEEAHLERAIDAFAAARRVLRDADTR